MNVLLRMMFVSVVVLATNAARGEEIDTPQTTENIATSARQEKVDYLTQIKPLLTSRCYACHGALKQEAGLRLDTAQAARNGGDSGPAVQPGKSSESLLIEAITGAGTVTRMPVEGKPLSEEQIALIRDWVDQGAESPADEVGQPDPWQHWAFRAPERPRVPTANEERWQRNPIDAFIAAEHQARGLSAAPQAAKHVLLRRVYLDLLGIPPTRAELDAFLANDSATAYEEVVDRLLASPRYGERWGRHWMDVWRYSDWDGHGGEVRESRPHIWRWRDWIIDSINQDKPYDQMIREMLAADEFFPADQSKLPATGFLVRNWFKFNRNTWLDNSVEHTGKAFLGLTFNCARCHDHKFDPISQHEYYAMRAFFEPYEIRDDRLPGEADVNKDALVRAYDQQLDAPTFLFTRGNESQPEKEKPIGPELPRVIRATAAIQPVSLPVAAYFPNSQPYILEELLSKADADIQVAKSKVTASELALAKLRSQIQTERESELVAAKNTQSQPANLWDQLADEVRSTDDLAGAKEMLWKFLSGKWEYQSNRLKQTSTKPDLSQILFHDSHPEDFVAKVRVRVVGGKVWKSTGLSFDQIDENTFTGVYLSAVEAGPKLQVFQRRNGVDDYSLAGTLEFPVALKHDFDLLIAVKDHTLNVAVNNEWQLSFALLPRPKNGHVALWTWDAQSEFSQFELATLRNGVVLQAEIYPNTPELSSQTTGERHRLLMLQAESRFARDSQRLVAHEASKVALKSRIAADLASVQMPAPPQSERDELARTASHDERAAYYQKAVLALLENEHAIHAQRIKENPTDGNESQAIRDLKEKSDKLTVARDKAKLIADAVSLKYTSIGKFYPKTSTGRRSALANAITDHKNTLTARVAVNHMWLRHFGSPLVSTMFDFGLNGKPPTHPALLDWLAVELQENGWQMKPLHRLMVTSQAYQMQATLDPEQTRNNQQRDPENQYLWRAVSRRLEAEAVRDSMLYVSRNLDLSMYGPDIAPEDQRKPRRSIYYRSSKEKKMTMLDIFDGPNPVECYRRAETVTPQQSLALANSEVSIAHSRMLARDISKEVEDVPTTESNAAFIEAAFLRVLCRPATAKETSLCNDFLQKQTRLFTSGTGLQPFDSSEKSTIPPASDPAQRAREGLVHTLFNHSDFITIR